MKRETGHYNRNARRSGGDRRHQIIAPRLSKADLVTVSIGMIIDTHPDWTLEQIGNEALRVIPGATIENVAAALEQYVSPLPAAPQGEKE